MREPDEIRAEQAGACGAPQHRRYAVIADNLSGRLVWQLHLADLDDTDPVDAHRELEDDLVLVADERNPTNYLAKLLLH